MNRRAPDTDDDGENPGFFRRNGVAIVVGILACLVGGVVFAVTQSGGHAPPPRQTDVVSIKPIAPPPKQVPTPPPPPPQATPDKVVAKQEMMEQSPISDEVAKPADEAPSDSGPMGTGIKGDGPDSFGLGSGRGNGGTGKGSGGGGQSMSKFGWWAAQVQTKIAEVLRTHPKTRSANCNIKVRIWPDTSGVIIKVRLVDSTGDRDLDEALKNDVLRGLKLTQPPPEGMPLPIVMRLRAQRTQ